MWRIHPTKSTPDRWLKFHSRPMYSTQVCCSIQSFRLDLERVKCLVVEDLQNHSAMRLALHYRASQHFDKQRKNSKESLVLMLGRKKRSTVFGTSLSRPKNKKYDCHRLRLNRQKGDLEQVGHQIQEGLGRRYSYLTNQYSPDESFLNR